MRCYCEESTDGHAWDCPNNPRFDYPATESVQAPGINYVIGDWPDKGIVEELCNDAEKLKADLAAANKRIQELEELGELVLACATIDMPTEIVELAEKLRGGSN